MRKEIKEKIFEIYKQKEKRRPIFEVDDKYSKSIVSLFLIQSDIQIISDSISKALELYKTKETKGKNLIISSLWQRAIITYGKIFSNSDNGFSKLEKALYILSEEEKEIHAELMTIRHKFIAHRGENDFENCILVAVVNKTKAGFSFEYTMPMAMLKGNYLKDELCKKTLDHLEKLKNRVEGQLVKKIEKLDKRIIEEFKKNS